MPIMLSFRNLAIEEAGGVVEQCNISSVTARKAVGCVREGEVKGLGEIAGTKTLEFPF